MKKLIIVLIASLILFGCQETEENRYNTYINIVIDSVTYSKYNCEYRLKNDNQNFSFCKPIYFEWCDFTIELKSVNNFQKIPDTFYFGKSFSNSSTFHHPSTKYGISDTGVVIISKIKNDIITGSFWFNYLTANLANDTIKNIYGNFYLRDDHFHEEE